MEPWCYVLLMIFLVFACAWYVRWALGARLRLAHARDTGQVRPCNGEQALNHARAAEKALSDLGVERRCYSAVKREDIGRVGYWHVHEDRYGFPHRDCPSCGRSDSVLVEIVPAFDGHASIRKIGTVCVPGSGCGRVRIDVDPYVLPKQATKAKNVAELIEILKTHPRHMPRQVVVNQLAAVEAAIRQSEKHLEQLGLERETLKLRLMAYDRPPNDGGPYRGSGMPAAAEPPEENDKPRMGGGWDVTFLPTLN